MTIKKTPAKRRKKKKPEVGDIDNLKTVTRKMLDRVGKELGSRKADPTKTEEDQQKAHERVFGKTSLATTLVTLAELLLKLEQAQKSSGEEENIPSGQAMALSDIALVEAFIPI